MSCCLSVYKEGLLYISIRILKYRLPLCHRGSAIPSRGGWWEGFGWKELEQGNLLEQDTRGESERAHNVKCDHLMLLFLLKILKYYLLVVCGGGRRNEE